MKLEVWLACVGSASAIQPATQIFALQAATRAPTPVTVKSAATQQQNNEDDEKDIHVRLQCGELTPVQPYSSTAPV